MITLFTFGPAFGLPDPSSFVTKADVLMKMSGLPYRTELGDIRKAPKGKLPYMDDDGTVIADSTLMRLHLESRHGIDFDKGLTPQQKGTAWAIEKMLEDHLYWVVVRERWMDQANYERGPKKFFEKVPALMRPMVIAMVHRDVKRTLHGQGLGRHSLEEMGRLSGRAIDGLAAHLGDNPWLMGATPCGADATAFSSVLAALCPLFESTSRRQIERHANLVAYRDRGMARWYPDFRTD